MVSGPKEHPVRSPAGAETSSDRPVPGYQVALPVFEGPLDLLLHLIERQELDITEVSLARITNQFLNYLAEVNERDPKSLAEFLVVAAKLLLIKSRVLLPQPRPLEADDEEADAGQDLVQQLLEYKRFKEAGQRLQEMEAQGLRSFVRLAPIPRLERSVDLGGVTLSELLAAVREVLSLKPPAPSVNSTVSPHRVTLAEQMDLIARATSKYETVSFLELLRQVESRLEIIVTLLALLEMIKRRRVAVRQDRPFGDILVMRTKAVEEQPET